MTSEEQMVTILREADEKSVPEVARKHGVSAQTIYAWRKHFGSLEPSDVKAAAAAGAGKRAVGDDAFHRVEEDLDWLDMAGGTTA